MTTASLKMYRDRTVFKVSRAMGGGGGGGGGGGVEGVWLLLVI